jgi:hypothetical protein
MPVEEVIEQNYILGLIPHGTQRTDRIVGLKGFDSTRFKYAKHCKEFSKNGYSLWSALEAAAYISERRLGYELQHRESGPMSKLLNKMVVSPPDSALTRTLLLYFREGGKTFVAVEDSPDSAINLFLRNPEKVLTACKSSQGLTYSSQDSTIQKIMKRSERAGRTFEIPCTFVEFPRANMRDFGSHPAIRAILGPLAEHYLATFSYEKAYWYENALLALRPRAGRHEVKNHPLELGSDVVELQVVQFLQNNIETSCREIFPAGYTYTVSPAREFEEYLKKCK